MDSFSDKEHDNVLSNYLERLYNEVIGITSIIDDVEETKRRLAWLAKNMKLLNEIAKKKIDKVVEEKIAERDWQRHVDKVNEQRARADEEYGAYNSHHHGPIYKYDI